MKDVYLIRCNGANLFYTDDADAALSEVRRLQDEKGDDRMIFHTEKVRPLTQRQEDTRNNATQESLTRKITTTASLK